MPHSALSHQRKSNPNAYNEVMADPDVLRWVNTWKQAGPELEAIRLEELRSTDTAQSLRMLASLFNQATRTHPPLDRIPASSKCSASLPGCTPGDRSPRRRGTFAVLLRSTGLELLLHRVNRRPAMVRTQGH